MPKKISIPITIKVPYGLANTMSIWFRNTSGNEINYTDKLFSYKVTKRENNLWFAEFKLGDVDGTDSYVQEKSIVKFFAEQKLVFKGIIQKVGYESLYFCVIQAKGMASELDKLVNDNDWSSGETTANILTTLVPAAASISLASDNDDYGTVSIRSEEDSNLRVIAKMTNMVEYYWWESYGNHPHNTDSLNFKSSQGGTNTYTFNDSGASINCNIVKRDKDHENHANYIVIKGYGDGVNQLKTINYHATDNRSTLSSALTSSGTTVSLVDASDFPSSGNVWIGCEKVTYAGKSGNNLTSCTRGAAFAHTGVTDAYAHDAGIEVWDAQYTIVSSESGSSIDTYGVIKKTFTDRSVISQNALDRSAQTMLAKRRNPVDVITVQASDMITSLNNIEIGDTITINADDTLDTDSGSTFTVKGMIFGFDEKTAEFCTIECSNKRLEFVDSIKTSMEETKDQAIYMQGSTNIYALSEKENCDSSTALSMRFYIPAEAIAINKVLLKFTAQKFRSHTSSSQTATSATHTHTIGASGSHPHGMEGVTSGGESAHVHGVVVDSGASGSPNVKVTSGGFETTDSSGGWTLLTQGGSDHSHAFSGQTTDAATHTHSISASGGHTHTITMSFGIYEAAFAATSVTVEVGAEGSESGVTGSPFSVSDGGTYSADITSEVKTVGAGNWCNIKFSPDDLVRIEANAYVQIFIKSE